MSVDQDVRLSGVDLCLRYRATQVVHDASIVLRPGVVTALVGPNGSGKSTLLRALARLHPIGSGGVRLDGDTPARALSAKEFARRVTLLAQSRPTPSGVTVRDVAGYGRHPYRGRWRAGDPGGPAAIARAMDVTGIAAMADRPADELSGGEIQRVWLATCLAQDTAVLLLRYQVEILDLTRDLAHAHGVAVGIVLHDLNQAAAVADRVVLLDAGRVRADGPPHEVFTEEILTAAYGIRIEVAADPSTGLLSTRPVGRHTRQTRHTTRHTRRTERQPA